MPAEPAPGQAADGQRAYEASVGIIRADFDGPPWAWDDLPPRHRAAFDAAAAAVAAPLNAEIARLREEAASLRAERDHLSAALAGDNEGVRLWMLDCGNLADRHRQEAAGLRRQLDAAAGSMFPKLRGRLAELEAEAARLREQKHRIAREALNPSQLPQQEEPS